MTMRILRTASMQRRIQLGSFLCFLLVTMTSGFLVAPTLSAVQQTRANTVMSSSPPAVVTAEEAATMTNFMAKAHEEKIQAMNRVEAKYKGRIEELEAKLAEMQRPSTGSEATSPNSYAFPATNKLLTEKVKAYQDFLRKYMINASLEKKKAVETMEAKLIAKYEAMIEEMKK